MKILLTGFKPFNKASINPTEEIISSLKDTYKDHKIYKLLLDVEYQNDYLKIEDKIREVNPDLVIMMGLAGGRKVVNLEAVALNIRHATISDNKGTMYLNTKIDEKLPLAYETNLDYKNIYEKMKSEKFMISYHAGTYICNDIYYNTLNYIYTNKLNIKCGFVHFPFLEGEKTNLPTMKLDEMKDILFKLIDSINE